MAEEAKGRGRTSYYKERAKGEETTIIWFTEEE